MQLKVSDTKLVNFPCNLFSSSMVLANHWNCSLIVLIFLVRINSSKLIFGKLKCHPTLLKIIRHPINAGIAEHISNITSHWMYMQTAKHSNLQQRSQATYRYSPADSSKWRISSVDGLRCQRKSSRRVWKLWKFGSFEKTLRNFQKKAVWKLP